MILPVCFVVDKNVCKHLEMICKSIKKTLTIPMYICVITDEEDTKKQIETHLSSFNDEGTFDVKLLKSSDTERVNNFYFGEGRTDIKALNYGQILISEYFPQFKKILFLEPDQIVKSDLAPFWKKVYETDIKLGAVNYGVGLTTVTTLQRLFNEGIVKSVKSYNCGVMVIDTEYWITNNFTELCFEAASKQKEMGGQYYMYYAEGSMNIALQNYIEEIDKKYNVCNLGHCPHLSREYIENSVILHWNGEKKPWLDDGLYKEYYTL